MLVRVIAPHFVAGIEVGVRAAPILAYATGWSLLKLQAYCRQKRWTCEVVG